MLVLLWIASSLVFSVYVFINHPSQGEEPFKCKRTFPHAAWTPTCSYGCLPWRPDSGRLIFSSTRRLINTETHHSGLMENNRGEPLGCISSPPISLVWTRSSLHGTAADFSRYQAGLP